MAVVKLTCGACGAPVSPGATTCPRCGESAQWPAGVTPGEAPDSPAAVCPVCGHRNEARGAYCASCGAALTRGNAVRPPNDDRPAAPVRGGRKIEGWKIAMGVAAAVLLALFGYLELNRPAPPAAPVQSAAPMEPPMEEVRRLQDAVRANPGDAETLLRLANRLHDMGLSAASLLPGAIDAYTQYLKLKPEDPNARVDLGICYFELGRNDSTQREELFRSAVREMNAAIAKAPNHQPAAFNLGVVSLFMGETEEATRWFRKTIEVGPETELGRRAKNLLEQHAFPSSAP